MDAKFEIVYPSKHLPVRYMYSNNQRPSYVLPHFHSELEIIYLLSGSVTIFRGLNAVTLYPGDIIIFQPNEIHSTQSEDPTTTAYVLQISYDFLNASCNASPLPSFHVPLIRAASEEELLHIKKLQSLIRHIFELDNGAKPYIYIKQQGILCFLIYELLENFKEFHNESMKNFHKNYSRILKIDTYLKEHYKEDLSLEDVSTYIGVTPPYFSRLFKNVYGIPYTKYLNSLRLEFARNDLLTTDYSILTISEKNGFANYQLFLLNFKQLYGCTPLAYRKMYKVQV